MKRNNFDEDFLDPYADNDRKKKVKKKNINISELIKVIFISLLCVVISACVIVLTANKVYGDYMSRRYIKLTNSSIDGGFSVRIIDTESNNVQVYQWHDTTIGEYTFRLPHH